MAKILVADDNSNIQKMVGLALKDQGIDVVAVGNGEAAVRKISEIRPDLVLADVFMPVRNGYEVCQYVKQDPSLAHIPVILLVGAFDPLDEQEAQRVGADGVLKKPFVPPDPLISMVKSALARAGVAIAAANSREKELEAVSKRAAQVLPTAGNRQDILHPVEAESLGEEVPSKRADLTIAAGDKTLAFGSLLDTPGLTEDIDDSAFVTAKPTEFETDRHWGGSSQEEADEVPEEEQAEEETASPSWRRDAANESQEVVAAKPPKLDWRTVEPATARNANEMPLTTKNPADETADLRPMLSTKPLPSFSGDAWAAAISAGTQEKIATEVRQEVSHDNAPADVPPVPAQAAEESRAVERENPRKTGERSSSTPSPWSVDGQTPGQLASAWEIASSNVEPETVRPVEAAPQQETELEHTPQASVEYAPQPVTEENLLESEEAPLASPYAAESLQGGIDSALEQAGAALQLPTDTVHLLQAEIQAAVASQHEDKAPGAQHEEETAHESPSATVQDHAEVNERIAEPETLIAAEEPEAAPSEPEVAKAPEVDMEALVARVLARMSPEALQAVTREILKPVLETIIRDEINAKKS